MSSLVGPPSRVLRLEAGAGMGERTSVRNFMTRVGMGRAILLGLVMTSAAGWAAASALAEQAHEEQSLPNVRYPEPNRIASGALDERSMASLKEAGVKHVINLRTAEEMGEFDEGAALAAHGITYSHLPITPDALSMENARKLDELLAQAGSDPTLVHCSSGNRVGALIALRAAWIYGRPIEEALEEGRRWGLAGLEAKVRSLLEK